MASSKTPATILVVGATGQQGGAVITALLGDRNPSTPEPRVLALTRNTQSAKAQQLTRTHPAVELIQGDMNKPEQVFSAAAAAAAAITAVFVVTTPNHGRGPGEDEVAIPFIDAAVAHGVGRVVFSSVDRGGDDKSWTNATDVPHFRQKHLVELHLREKLAAGGEESQSQSQSQQQQQFSYTIVRPVAFMDNMNPGIACSVMTAAWAAALSPGRKLQLVSVRDVGRVAARALLADYDDGDRGRRYKNAAIGVAGDELSLEQVKEVFARVTGKSLPQAWWPVGGVLLWALGELGSMFGFFEREGYGVELDKMRLDEAGAMLDFETWLKEESGWMKT
ncbi:uncharacterized protein PpBr36_10118 [Pyricularia pennisetigena]|uniref:uncharacterized protein n=1 Tax=Pyricularia pennisetigena TaxID=1578925 RepID=UPI0011502375|nr:uncharacterized protein PpBr36_10118 [Pyricularia pennisetigena]TLS21600.1 hypothetical protein PpBr36_10118 [Pyricularia pennisetigena]